MYRQSTNSPFANLFSAKSPFWLNRQCFTPPKFLAIRYRLTPIVYNYIHSSFRGSNTSIGLDSSGLGLTWVYNLIKDVQKSFRTREQEKKELEGYKEQEQLILSINKGNPRLKDLYIRPLLTSRRVLVSVCKPLPLIILIN